MAPDGSFDDVSNRSPGVSSIGQSSSCSVEWTLHRGGDLARCCRRNTDTRVELELTMSGIAVARQPCSGPERAAFVSDLWRNALMQCGWHPDAPSVFPET